MIHLRIVAPPELAKQVLDLLCSRPSRPQRRPPRRRGAPPRRRRHSLRRRPRRRQPRPRRAAPARRRPERDDLARDDRHRDLDAARVAEGAAVGSPADAVVWEEVENRTSESAELSSQLSRLHGPRHPDRRRRDPHRLRHLDHRRDGRRARVRAARRTLRCTRPATLVARPSITSRPRDRFSCRDRRHLPGTLLLRAADRGPEELGDHPATLFISTPISSRSSSRCSPGQPAYSPSRPRNPAL